MPRHCGQQHAEEYPQRRIIDPGDAEREMADAAAEQVHFAQHRAENRQRGDTRADAHRRGELRRADARCELLRVARQDPVADQTAETGGHHHAGYGHNRRGAPVTAKCLGVEMQSGDQAENQNRHRPDPGQRRQRGLIKKQLVIFRGEPTE